MKGIEIHLELGPTIDVRSGVLAGSVADMIPMWQTLVHAPSIFSTRQAIPSVIWRSGMSKTVQLLRLRRETILKSCDST